MSKLKLIMGYKDRHCPNYCVKEVVGVQTNKPTFTNLRKLRVQTSKNGHRRHRPKEPFKNHQLWYKMAAIL